MPSNRMVWVEFKTDVFERIEMLRFCYILGLTLKCIVVKNADMQDWLDKQGTVMSPHGFCS